MQMISGGREQVRVAGATIRQVVNNLEGLYPGIKDRLLQDDALMPGLSVAVDGEFSRLGLMEPVGENSEIHFLPAISGGSLSSPSA